MLVWHSRPRLWLWPVPWPFPDLRLSAFICGKFLPLPCWFSTYPITNPEGGLPLHPKI
jgi:hypothetical protein